ncbi:Fungal lipase-like domain containing protein [Trema orientale]|uniref:Phospholipase A1 n=1 Tax=Trema orientale TaxID=63057 RepID=A0A2P5FF79_TREOI|nr:Fungal lipase-like domain containing protein [Trema orientale]
MATVITPNKKANDDAVSPTWEELLGSKNWEGLVEPELDLSLRKFILRCGDFAEATYDCFNSNTISPQCGNTRYGRDTFFHDVKCENASNYQVVSFLYGTSGLGDVQKNMFLHPNDASGGNTWDSESNWMGYVAVTTDKASKTLGRREIYVAWRGTITTSEWQSNIFGASPVPAKPLLANRTIKSERFLLWGTDEPKIHEGWLSIYTSDNSTSKYVKTSARVQLTTAIEELVEKYKNEKLSVVVTGHSLGGALATLSAFDLVENDVVGDNILVSAFVFGCPQVGNSEFKTIVDTHKNLKIFHVKNVRDAVPQLPDVGLLIYVPIQTVELEIDTNKSPYLKSKSITDKFGDWHNLEANLHVVAGWNGPDSKYELKVKRSLALVNKSCRFLKEELNVPEYWWVEKSKGMVLDEETREWVLDPPPPADQLVKISIN